MAVELVAVPLAVQAVAMAFDELHFHRRRGLGRWERVGHPIDTLTVIACVAWALFATFDARDIAVYAALAIVSCATITKDEPVHSRRCSPGEHWLHAVLFVLHPICLMGIALLWAARTLGVAGDALGAVARAVGEGPVPRWVGLAGDAAIARALLVVQLLVTCLFCAYQAAYWNIPWPRTASRAR